MSLSLVHFSDIHIENEHDVVLERLEKIESACVSALPHNGTVLIVVSGDIANRGKVEQYDIAKVFFDKFKICIEEKTNSNVIYAFAPGNHDCDFALNGTIRNVLLKSIKTETINQEYYSKLVGVQENYFNFVNKYNYYDPNRIINTIPFEMEGDSFLVVIANTAWMSELHENPGNIVMPANLIEEVEIESNKYKYVFYTFHHPTNWICPDKKREFISHIRKTTDFLLLGHEHERDSYTQTGENFSFICSHGKELQDRDSKSSAFSVYNFDNGFQNYTVLDYIWEGDKYKREKERTNQIHKNDISHQSVYCPNRLFIEQCEDMGITLNHFIKEDVSLSDLYVCPDVCRYTYGKNNDSGIKIRDNFLDRIIEEKLTVIIGSTSQGKTALSKYIFLSEENKNNCCVLLDGSVFNSSNISSIRDTITEEYAKQYSPETVEDFILLQKEERIVIVDNFDYIKNNNNRRSIVLDYLAEQFDKVIILFSTDLELTTIIQSKTIKSFESFYYYEILPLGNRKRKQIISKWYNLDNFDQTEDEINERIERAQTHINSFIGDGAAFIPAIPLFVLSTLQNIDAKKMSFENSKFSFLYESLIKSSIAKIANGDYDSGRYDMDSSALSHLAFNMIKLKRTSFSQVELEAAVDYMNKKYILKESSEDLLNRMLTAKIIYKDFSEGESYRFKYPYIFYYFAGMYIAEHLSDAEVIEKVEYMSSRLYNETYGNVMIFVCHFANSKEVIDSILLNAYSTFDGLNEFEFTKSNPVFEEIKDSLKMIVPKTISDNSGIAKNQEESLKRKDEAGITDGQVKKEEEFIDDEVTEKEKEMAEVTSAFKTMEVLGQILKNYPTKVDGKDKLDIIDEIHRLGMRSVDVLVKTMIDYKSDLVEYIYEKIKLENKTIRKEMVIQSVQRFIDALVSGTARSMIHQVAKSIDNEHLLEAATISLSSNKAISAKLVLLDLKLNCLKKCDYTEIRELRKVFVDSNELFATYTLDSIVGYYLNYNRCDVKLRSKLCALCGFSKQTALIETHKNIENM